MSDPSKENSGGNGAATAAESGGNGAAEAQKGEAATAVPSLIVNAQYVKDLSFEAPGAPEIFRQMQNQTPDISVSVNVQAQPLDPPIFEVVVQLRADCKYGETVGYIVELAYGGVFTLNIEADKLRPMLLIECPRLLFPFARQILVDSTARGGFQPLMLNPVDFAGLYQQQLRQQAERAAPEPPLSEA